MIVFRVCVCVPVYVSVAVHVFGVYGAADGAYLQDGVFGGEIQRLAALDRDAEASAREASDRLVGVGHRHRNAGADKVNNVDHTAVHPITQFGFVSSSAMAATCRSTLRAYRDLLRRPNTSMCQH